MNTKPHLISLFSLIFLAALTLLTLSPVKASQPPLIDTSNLVYLPVINRNYQSGYGIVTGKTLDARTGDPVIEATVCVESLPCVTSDLSGNYTISDIPDGYRSITAAAVDYESANTKVTVKTNQTTNLNLELLPMLTEGEFRIALTWDSTSTWPPDGIENDLDIHLWTPFAEPNHHIEAADSAHHGNCADLGVEPFACIEADARRGSGPEVLLLATSSGTFSVGVLHFYNGYEGVPPITTLNVKVEIEDSSGVLRTFQVPPLGDGDLWYVFDFVDGTIDTAGSGCLTHYASPGDIPPVCQTANLGIVIE